MINLCNENSQCVAHDFRRKAKTKACVFRSKALILKERQLHKKTQKLSFPYFYSI